MFFLNYHLRKTERVYWIFLLVQLRKLWSEDKHLPGVPPDDVPDLKSCLLYQQFQVINCCISRKRRHIIATEAVDSMVMEANSNTLKSGNHSDRTSASPVLYARISTGELVLRLGALCPSGDLTLLETGEPMYTPITQVWSIFVLSSQYLNLLQYFLIFMSISCRREPCLQKIWSKRQRSLCFGQGGLYTNWGSFDPDDYFAYVCILSTHQLSVF